MADKIFINYRRDDSIAAAGRLSDRLIESFGRDQIFIDVDNMPAGVDFVAYLKEQVAACDVFLVIIGPDWLDAKDANGQRRLDDPDDYVAIEIAAALERSIRVIPVLIDGARMPNAAELADRLKQLVRRHAEEVRNSQFSRDAEALIARVDQALSSPLGPEKKRSDKSELEKLVDNARLRSRVNAGIASFLGALLSSPLIHYIFPGKIVDVDIPVRIAAIPWLFALIILIYLTFLAPRWEPPFGKSFSQAPRHDRERLRARVSGIRLALRQPIMSNITGVMLVILSVLGLFAILRALYWMMFTLR
jgi:hypothetical protein